MRPTPRPLPALFGLLLAWLAAAATSAAATPVPAPIAPLPADARFAPLRDELRAMVEAGALPSISVGVLHQGRLVWAESLGWADRERAVAATIDTPYAVASIGKAFTATAALILVEQGRMGLDSPVSEMLPGEELRLPAGGRPPTLRELLNMTGGVPHGALTYRTGDRPGSAAIERRRFVAVFPPGEVFHYSNFSIAMVDAAIERVSRRPFGAFMREAVFAPLGMTHSALGSDGLPLPPAVRYFENGPVGAMAPFPRSSRAMHASLADLLRFAAFHSGTPRPGQQPILSPAMLERQHNERSGLAGAHMALGWASLDLDGGGRWLVSSGNDMGAQSNISIFPEAGIAVVVLSNGSGYQADELALRAADVLAPGLLRRAAAAGEAFEAHSRPYARAPDWTGRWEGRIETPAGPVPIAMTFSPEGDVTAAVGGAHARAVEEATMRAGLFSGATTGRLALEEAPVAEHRIEFGLHRAGDTLAGFVVANFASPRGKFEIPAFVRMERSAG